MLRTWQSCNNIILLIIPVRSSSMSGLPSTTSAIFFKRTLLPPSSVGFTNSRALYYGDDLWRWALIRSTLKFLCALSCVCIILYHQHTGTIIHDQSGDTNPVTGHMYTLLNENVLKGHCSPDAFISIVRHHSVSLEMKLGTCGYVHIQRVISGQNWKSTYWLLFVYHKNSIKKWPTLF